MSDFWPSYLKVPEDVRKEMYARFTNIFGIRRSERGDVHKAYQTKARGLYKRMMNKTKEQYFKNKDKEKYRGKKKTSWKTETLEAKAAAHWDTEDHKKKSVKGKKARRGGVEDGEAPATFYSGSIDYEEIQRRLEMNQPNRTHPIRHDEIYKAGHTRKVSGTDRGTGRPLRREWKSQATRLIYNTYKKELRTKNLDAVEDKDFLEWDTDSWKKAIGMIMKGNAHGIPSYADPRDFDMDCSREPDYKREFLRKVQEENIELKTTQDPRVDSMLSWLQTFREDMQTETG